MVKTREIDDQSDAGRNRRGRAAAGGAGPGVPPTFGDNYIVANSNAGSLTPASEQ